MIAFSFLNTPFNSLELIDKFRSPERGKQRWQQESEFSVASENVVEEESEKLPEPTVVNLQLF